MDSFIGRANSIFYICILAPTGSKGGQQGENVSQPNTIKAKRSLRQYNSFVEGLTDEEIEVERCILIEGLGPTIDAYSVAKIHRIRGLGVLEVKATSFIINSA